jgi:sialic acid synthase SpsE
VNIGGMEVGHDVCLPFVIADLSANHLGSFDRAVQLVYAARKAGVSAVKVQVYDPARMAIRRGGSVDAVCTEEPWAGRKFLSLYMEAYTPRSWYRELSMFHSCMFSSVFDVEDVNDLEQFEPPCWKIASREAADVDLVTRAAQTGKPLIISTGTATDDQLGRSIAEAAKYTNQIALLYCVSKYPTDPAEIDYDEIGALRKRFGLPVGFSDHTLGVESAVKAVEAGACIIEKHLTLARSDGGPDAAFSLEPHEFAELVRRVKDASR